MKHNRIAQSNVKPEGLGQAFTMPEKGAGVKHNAYGKS
jgi:hypothetical protein